MKECQCKDVSTHVQEKYLKNSKLLKLLFYLEKIESLKFFLNFVETSPITIYECFCSDKNAYPLVINQIFLNF